MQNQPEIILVHLFFSILSNQSRAITLTNREEAISMTVFHLPVAHPQSRVISHQQADDPCKQTSGL